MENNSYYIEALAASFVPALSAADATHWFSTDEVFLAIKRRDPSAEITKDELHNLLIDAGYLYQNRPGALGLDFKWMFKTTT